MGRLINLGTRYAVGVVLALGLLCEASGQVPVWGQPGPLNSYHNEDSGSNDHSPKIATDGSGNYVALWTKEQGTYTAKSSDGGANWAAPVRLGGHSTPANVVYAGNGNWALAFYTTFIYDLTPQYTNYAACSTDGVSWESKGISSSRVLDMESNEAGVCIAVVENGLRRSTDFGQTWSAGAAPATVGQPGAKSFVSYNGQGKWFLLVENGTDRVYTSADSGATWVGPVNVPADFGGYMVDMAAFGETVVPNGANVVSTDGGVSWQTVVTGFGSTERNQITVDDSGNWIQLGFRKEYGNHPDRYSQLQVRRSSNPAVGWSQPTILTDASTIDWHCAVTGSGNGSFMLLHSQSLVQTIRPGGDYDIRMLTTTDGGVNWSAPQYVNNTHSSDFPHIRDEHPQVVSGDGGVMLAAWATDVDGDQVYDHVMFARSDNYGATWSNSAPATPFYGSRTVDFESFQLLYAGQGRWLIRWNPGAEFEFEGARVLRFGDYVISDDNGFTWSGAQRFEGDLAASNGSGTVVKVRRGNDPIQGIYSRFARLPRNATVWEEPQVIYGVEFRVLVHSGGENWFAVSDDDRLYVSSDNGHSWSAGSGMNLPPAGARYASSHSGVVLAMYADTSSSSNELFAVKSVDNGNTWETAGNIGTVPVFLYTDDVNSRWGHITYAGDETWVACWSRGTVEVSVSKDSGATWSTPQQVVLEETLPYRRGQVSPQVAAAEGRVSLVWGENPYLTSDSPSEDEDVYFIAGLLDAPAAAGDWQLFE